MREYTIDPTLIPKVFVYDFYVLCAIRRRMLKNEKMQSRQEYKNHLPQTAQQQPPLQCTHDQNSELQEITQCYLSFLIDKSHIFLFYN